MQTVIQVLSSSSKSLRDRIAKGHHLGDYDLVVTEVLRPGRPHGWTKIHSKTSGHGAINIQWLPDAKVLLCRVITRGNGDPAPITGAFTSYLLRWFKREILTIVIRPDA